VCPSDSDLREAVAAGPGDDERAQHVVRIRDLRSRVDAPESYSAHCSCGWKGDEHPGQPGERLARREGREHTERERLARYAPRPGARLAR
jgi:hypothetical protein